MSLFGTGVLRFATSDLRWRRDSPFTPFQISPIFSGVVIHCLALLHRCISRIRENFLHPPCLEQYVGFQAGSLGPKQSFLVPGYCADLGGSCSRAASGLQKENLKCHDYSRPEKGIFDVYIRAL